MTPAIKRRSNANISRKHEPIISKNAFFFIFLIITFFKLKMRKNQKITIVKIWQMIEIAIAATVEIRN